MTYKIGVGVITVQKRLIHPNILNLISHPTQFYVYTDFERKGVAHARNECIENLYNAGCDYIFLFDDDTYPIKYGWQDYFIEEHLRSGIHCFGNPSNHGTVYRTIDDINYWQWAMAQFHFMTRKMVETVGYYNPEYVTYGWEDVGYMYRARKSGLCGKVAGDPSPKLTSEYIQCDDMSTERHEPIQAPKASGDANMSVEEKQRFIKLNEQTFRKEIASGKIYYSKRR